jgi:hypothetical protein
VAQEMLPWLVAPRNKKEFDELESRFSELSNEIYVKMQIISSQTSHRLRKPKRGSKWAEKLAWARIDLKVYARSVVKPMGQCGAAAVAMGKAFRLSYTRFYEIHSVAAPNSSGSGAGGFDFD